MTKTRLCRTFQTAPAAVPRDDSAKYLRSGLTAEGFSAPDWLVPDLEDGTAPEMKDEALENVRELLPEYAPAFSGEIWPRVEWAYDSESLRERGVEQIETLAETVGEHVDGFVVPKVGRLEDVNAAESAVAAAGRETGTDIELAVIVESARARSDLREISKFGHESLLTALVFGPVDYTAELGGREIGKRPDWSGLCEALSNEASANDLLSIGGPFDRLFRERAGVTFYNGDGYADHVEREARVGLDGSWSLHPNQTAQANRIHLPTTDELRTAVSKIETFVEAKGTGTGAVAIDGQMVDEATLKNFENTVETVAIVHGMQDEQTKERYDDGLLDRALALR
ncbi:beta-methylmalyl-CoA/(S)-malyl-CoA lyase [Haladaptatus litoreus]|uniref:Beta-methylmalyl-CoA/(S)-malyl-CoA lyase n=1 Tax=Haladaptatus litoreus TaxID=553468 RepID=A0A1N7E915_9EURY|nr:L-malyl-CoA/beta-methylmalyl-CoA lyase [Haladaptatus litoreus]SIR84498.1 beta-methylmalyl-CoA/(S)-malyl-CoA lyase [Haladaptatus litoreus]